MRSAKIPDLLRGDKIPTTITASEHDGPPISPYSGKRMESAFCRDTPVFVDQEKRIVVPCRRDSNI